jgi:hypothetical protein
VTTARCGAVVQAPQQCSWGKRVLVRNAAVKACEVAGIPLHPDIGAAVLPPPGEASSPRTFGVAPPPPPATTPPSLSAPAQPQASVKATTTASAASTGVSADKRLPLGVNARVFGVPSVSGGSVAPDRHSVAERASAAGADLDLDLAEDRSFLG